MLRYTSCQNTGHLICLRAWSVFMVPWTLASCRCTIYGNSIRGVSYVWTLEMDSLPQISWVHCILQYSFQIFTQLSSWFSWNYRGCWCLCPLSKAGKCSFIRVVQSCSRRLVSTMHVKVHCTVFIHQVIHGLAVWLLDLCGQYSQVTEACLVETSISMLFISSHCPPVKSMHFVAAGQILLVENSTFMYCTAVFACFLNYVTSEETHSCSKLIMSCTRYHLTSMLLLLVYGLRTSCEMARGRIELTLGVCQYVCSLPCCRKYLVELHVSGWRVETSMIWSMECSVHIPVTPTVSLS